MSVDFLFNNNNKKNTLGYKAKDTIPPAAAYHTCPNITSNDSRLVEQIPNTFEKAISTAVVSRRHALPFAPLFPSCLPFSRLQFLHRFSVFLLRHSQPISTHSLYLQTLKIKFHPLDSGEREGFIRVLGGGRGWGGG